MRRITRALVNEPEDSGKVGPLQAGVTLQDRYLVLGVLGTGGMGAVYRGRDLHFPNVNKLVAVKEMVSTATDPTIHEMIVRNFEREGDLLATLSHPAIPRIYDHFTQGNNAYLVMEFIEGEDLESMLRGSDEFLPVDTVLSWAIEICDVLEYLHSRKPQPVIFRDIKPSNIMIDQHGHVRLIDFGIARFFQPGEKGTMIGTEGYSPPEQYRGEASQAGDIYALGATLHHLLTRRDPRAEPPFSFDERPIRDINPSVPQELVDVINGSLAYEPKDRYNSAEAMKRVLLSVASEAGVLPAARGTVAYLSQGDVKELWSFECEDEVRGTPLVHGDIVYVGSYDNNLYALDAKRGEFLWKYATEGGIPTRPAAFEDSVFVTSEDLRLHAVNATNGNLLWLYGTEGPIRSSPVVYERHVLFGCDDGFLHVVSLLTGQRAWRTQASGPIRSTPLIANEHVYFGNEQGDFYCVNFQGDVKWRFRAKRAITSSALAMDSLVSFGSMDSTLYALEAKGGWEVWRFRMGSPTISSPVYAEGKIFTGCADGNVYAIDARTSREVWRFQTQHQVTGSPILHEDSLFIGSVDGSMYCLEYRTGRMRWQYVTGGPITGSAVVSDGVLYFGSTDRRVYALLS